MTAKKVLDLIMHGIDLKRIGVTAVDDELREICQRLLDYVGDLDEGGVLEVETEEGDMELREIPSELYGLLTEIRDYLEEEQ